MRSASSKTFWLLPSLALAFGALAWSAQHGPRYPKYFVAWVEMAPGSATRTFTYDPAGSGFFGPVPPRTIVVGVDTVIAGAAAGRTAVCGTVIWSRGKPVSSATYPCGPGGGHIRLRKVP